MSAKALTPEQEKRAIVALRWMTTTILFQERDLVDDGVDIVLSKELTDAVNLLDEIGT